MEFRDAASLAPLLTAHGRTWQDGDVLHLNWSCAGVEFTFHGTSLAARFAAYSSEEIDGVPFDANAPRRPVWPCAAVFLDGADVPVRTFAVEQPEADVPLLAFAAPQTHRVRLVKLTENFKTGLSFCGLLLEGEILPETAPAAAGTQNAAADMRNATGPQNAAGTQNAQNAQNTQNAPAAAGGSEPAGAALRSAAAPGAQMRLECIGDSITCGFGNASREPSRFFYAHEENGWLAYGPRAARALGMDVSLVCISGITLAPHEAFPMPYCIRDLYRCTDRPGAEKLHPAAAPQPWDFAAARPDYIVLDLGTNDANAVLLSADPEAEERGFERDYAEFLHTLRACNGPQARIFCALGSMDYYLWDAILRAVRAYQAETGDENVRCLKFHKMSFLDAPGAAGHPGMATHEKMAAQLAAAVRAWEAQAR